MRVHRDSLHDIEWLSSEQLSDPLSGGIALMRVCQEYHHNPRPDQTMENVEVISVWNGTAEDVENWMILRTECLDLLQY